MDLGRLSLLKLPKLESSCQISGHAVTAIRWYPTWISLERIESIKYLNETYVIYSTLTWLVNLTGTECWKHHLVQIEIDFEREFVS